MRQVPTDWQITKSGNDSERAGAVVDYSGIFIIIIITIRGAYGMVWC